MASRQSPFNALSSATELLMASSGLQHALDSAQGGAAAAMMRLFREQETIETRMAILSPGRDLRLEALNVATGLQSRVGSLVDGYLAAEQDRVRASITIGQSMRFVDALTAHEQAREAAVHEYASNWLNDGILGRQSAAEYAWELAQAQSAGHGISDFLSAAQRDRASLVNDLLESYLSSSEYSPDGLEYVEYRASKSDSSADDTQIADLEATSRQSKVVKGVVSKIAANPSGFQRGQTDQYRIALLTLYLSLVFGLMEHVRWHLDNVEKQREAAESAKEKAALVEQQQQAAKAAESLSRTLQILLEQAVAKEICVVGERAATVRSLPRSGLKLGDAHTNQEVLVTGKSTRWVKIRYRDHLEAREVEGWV